jgi:hypothetical protein
VNTVIASTSSSTKFSHPTFLVWLCTIGLLFASLPGLPSVLHVLYVVSILQVWLKLPTSWRAAEDRRVNMSRPPPLPDPKPSKSAKRRNRAKVHQEKVDSPSIDPRLLENGWENTGKILFGSVRC